MRKIFRRTAGVIWRLVNVICFTVGAITILLLLSAKIAYRSEAAKESAGVTITEEAMTEEAKEPTFAEKKAEDLAESMSHPEYLFRRNTLGSLLINWDRLKGSCAGMGERILSLWAPAG